MPTYIYINPETQEEIEIFHSMQEALKPSPELLKKITLEDGTVMKRKLVAPALLGFDNLGRSVKKNGDDSSSNSTSSNGSDTTKTTEKKAPEKKAAEPVAAKP
jgi:hypothetical protein